MGRREFVGVQYLRALAALAVVIYHFQPHLGVKFNFFAAGVDVFFVISGFIIWQSVQNMDRSAWEWWKARFWRVVPLYWIATTAMVALLLLGGNALDLAFVAKSYLLVPVFNDREVMLPVLEPGWTLTYEMFFYTVVAVALLARNAWVRLGAVMAFLCGLIALRPLASWEEPILYRLTSPLFLEFLAGVGIAVIRPYAKEKGIAGLIALAGAVGFMAFAYPLIERGPRALYFGMPAAMLVLAVVFLERHMPQLPRLKLLGDASYSLYLSHLIVAVPVVWLAGLVGVEGWVLFAVLVTASTFASVGVYRWVEKPLLSWAGRGGARVRESGQSGQIQNRMPALSVAVPPSRWLSSSPRRRVRLTRIKDAG